MPFSTRALGLLAKLETTYGTDAVPTGAANAMFPVDVEITPIDGRSIERQVERPWFGSEGEIQVEGHVSLSFKTELGSAGAAGTAPAWGVLMRGAGFAETITASVKAEYSPVSTGQEALSLYTYKAGALHKALGARGDFVIDLPANELPMISWEYKGLYAAVAAAAVPSLTLTPWKAPIPATKINTPTFTLHGFTGSMMGLKINIGNELNPRFPIGPESVNLTNRVVTGELRCEAPDPGTKDWFAASIAGTKGALAVVHGTVAGAKIQIDAPQVQVGRPKYYDDKGVVCLAIPLRFTPSAGNDELKITAL